MISVVLPCYNAQKHISETLTILEDFFPRNFKAYELICVNDGSSDKTVEEIEKYIKLHSDTRARLVSYEKNMGKGYAVQQGILASEGEYIVFVDADLPVTTSCFSKMINILKSSADVVLADRREGKDAYENAGLIRRFVSFCGYILCRIVLGIKIRDTQAGFKGFRREAALLMAGKQTMKRFSFDIEYIYISLLNNLEIKQLSVVYENDTENSSVHVFRDIFRSVADIFKIRSHKREYLKK